MGGLQIVKEEDDEVKLIENLLAEQLAVCNQLIGDLQDPCLEISPFDEEWSL